MPDPIPAKARKPFRVLVTASRTFTDEQPIRDALAPIIAMHGPENVVVVHGDAEGGDKTADRIATAWTGVTVERHPADWGRCSPSCRPAHRRGRRDHTTYCPAAGLRRDAEMVALGADLCLAFIDPCTKPGCRKIKPHGSHGASHTADLAEKAGIPTRRYERRSGV